MSLVDHAHSAPSKESDLPQITKVADLMQRIRATRGAGDALWYRGQTNASWTLHPKIARNDGHLQDEVAMLKHFRQDASPRLRDKPGSQWEWIFLAQHYGLPTRLLDWSENPLIGLYFAVESDNADMHEPVSGALFELNANTMNAQTMGEDDPGVIMFDHDHQLENYLPGSSAGRLTPVAAIASRSFDRIVAQSGTFTITHKDHVLDTTDERFGVHKLEIPAFAKPMLREELADLNIRASTVYPDLDHLAQSVTERHRR